MSLDRRSLLHWGAGALATLAGCSRLGDSEPTGGDRTEPDRTGRGDQSPEIGTAPETETASTPDGPSVAWTRGPDMPRNRTQTSAVGLEGILYVIGGITDDGERATDIYDPDAERWSEGTPPPKPVNHAAAVAYDGRIHVLGGYTGSFLGGDPLSAHWVYDPDGDAWTDAPELPTPRGAMVAAVADDRIFAIGGATEEGTTDVVEVYDPAAESWASAASMPTAREHLSAGVIDGRIYVAGGRQGLSPMVDATERYDPARDAWRTFAAMPTARAGIAGDVLGGRLFVFGGEEVGEQVFEEVEAYHPPSDSWSAVAGLPTPRWGLGAATIEDRIYTVGGGAVPSAEYTSVLEILALA